MTMRRTPRSQAGFTLIEVLVALALMALVSLMAWRGLASVSGARDLIAAQAEDTDAIVRTLGQMARDVELSYTGPAFDSPGLDAVGVVRGVRVHHQAHAGGIHAKTVQGNGGCDIGVGREAACGFTRAAFKEHRSLADRIQVEDLLGR